LRVIFLIFQYIMDNKHYIGLRIMNKKTLEGKFIEAILPYLIFGISIAVAVSLIVIFFYLFMWGLIIGLVLWGIMTLKEKFFPSTDKAHVSHKVLHVEEDGSVVVEEDRTHSSVKPKKRTHRGDK
jgi:hypothetical protein